MTQLANPFPQRANPAQAATPLSAHPLFVTGELDEARDRVSRVYCDHRLERIGRDPMRVTHNRLDGAQLSVNFMTYGAKAQIVPGALESFYLLQVPLRGFASVTNGADHYVIGGGSGAVLNPDVETSMIWSDGCAQIMLQLDRAFVTSLARAHFGLPGESALRFRGPTDLRQGTGRDLLELIFHISREADMGHVVIGDASLLSRELERTLILGLLETLPSNLSRHGETGRGPSPRIIRQAERFMEANLGEPLSLADIAQAAGTSSRTLQVTFRTHRNMSPMERLRDFRLQKLWADLSNPTPETTVTGAATRWGFSHLGRLTADYRRKYGCNPVETLRQARGQ